MYEVPSQNTKKLAKAEFEYINSDDDEKIEESQSPKKVFITQLLSYKQTWAFFIGKDL